MRRGPVSCHPMDRDLLRFAHAEPLAPAERRGIVRHLLAGCPRCAAVLQPFWKPGQGPRAGKGRRHAHR